MFFVLLFIFLVNSAGGATWAQNSPPLGMVLQSSGKVVLERGSEKRAARLADLLYAGDRIRATSGTVTLLFCPSSEKLQLKKGSVLEVLTASTKTVSGPKPVREKSARCALPKVALGSESLERMGAVRARGYPPLAVYLGGKISTARPQFEWEAVPGAREYVLVLRAESGAVLWQPRTDQLSLDYPETKPALESGGSYQWEVRAEGEGKTLGQQSASFEVRPSEEFQIRPADDAGRLLLAADLEAAGYFADAARLFRQLRDTHPGDERLTHHLVWLYWNASLVTASSREREKIKK
ncbi:MAG: hypothetical protein ACR2L2_00360 [Acidobacteriota bacterium]